MDVSGLHIHFTGAGGVGMAGLAHLAMDRGAKVSGSDLVDSGMLQSLRVRGADIRVGHWEELPQSVSLLVYSSAVPEWDAERAMAAKRGIRQVRRGDFLNLLALSFPVRVAVSGSHGKTSTSAMLTHILREAGLEPGYLVGGQVNGIARSASAGAGRILVSEVDESDGSQAGFPATLALVMNIEDDHSWGLGGVRALECCFLQLCYHARKVLAWDGETTRRLFAQWRRASLLSTPLETSQIPQLPGWHNRIDAAMAVEAACILGVARERAVEALKSFRGVARRMTCRYCGADGRILIEDYAHHPTELKATLDAIREAYPGHRLLVLFQPHRMERVERYGDRFAELLSCVDWCGIVEPFGAWRTDGHCADVKSCIANRVTAPCCVLPNDAEAMAEAALQQWRSGEAAVLAVIGAGDVNRVLPNLLENVKDGKDGFHPLW